MRPELPYMAAGTVAIVGGIAREGAFPKAGLNAVVGTVILVVVVSATAGTAVAPLARAIGMLLLLASVMAAVPAFTTKGLKK